MLRPALLFVLCISSPFAYAISSTTTRPKNVCSGHRESVVPLPRSGAWLPLNHRYGPCSPFPSSERSPTPEDVLHRDRLRANDIIRRRKRGGGSDDEVEATVPTTLGSSLKTLEYVVTVGLGTPAVNQTVHIDTGSDVSWVQCRPCPMPPCHDQKDALFDPAKSSTYSAVRCGSTACRDLGRDFGNGCSSGRRSLCRYVVRYADGSNTTGTYSSDTLTLTPEYSVNGFLFGCGHEDHMISANLADGLMGLGGGKSSLVSQTKEKAFSYCLPPSATYSGFLTLGASPRSSASSFAVTPLYKNEQVDTFYVVLLQAILVAGRRVNVDPSAFATGAVMDSGTVITRLPPSAYRALRAAFRREMRRHGYQRASPPSPESIFDTCYNLTAGDDVKVPGVALVFDGGATVELDRSSGIMYDGCLAFASTGKDDASSPGIIGNVQQRTIEVLYDIGGNTIGFRPGAC